MPLETPDASQVLVYRPASSSSSTSTPTTSPSVLNTLIDTKPARGIENPIAVLGLRGFGKFCSRANSCGILVFGCPAAASSGAGGGCSSFSTMLIRFAGAADPPDERINFPLWLTLTQYPIPG